MASPSSFLGWTPRTFEPLISVLVPYKSRYYHFASPFNLDTISRDPFSPFTNLPASSRIKSMVAYLVTTVNLYSSSSLFSFSRVLLVRRPATCDTATLRHCDIATLRPTTNDTARRRHGDTATYDTATLRFCETTTLCCDIVTLRPCDNHFNDKRLRR